MRRSIKRDPFARLETVREAVKVYGRTSCDWCGQVRETKRGTKFLYRYDTESDGGRVFPGRGLFCSYSCCRSYHS